MKVRAALFSLLLATSFACGHKVERCWVCDREIHSQVRATLTLGNGKEVAACCPRCALHYKQEPGHEVRRTRVTDYSTGESLALDRAFLVEGSDEIPCVHNPPVMDEARVPMQVCYDRCMPSLIAFHDAASASAFIAEHGGSPRAPGTPLEVTSASR